MSVRSIPIHPANFASFEESWFVGPSPFVGDGRGRQTWYDVIWNITPIFFFLESSGTYAKKNSSKSEQKNVMLRFWWILFCMFQMVLRRKKDCRKKLLRKLFGKKKLIFFCVRGGGLRYLKPPSSWGAWSHTAPTGLAFLNQVRKNLYTEK